MYDRKNAQHQREIQVWRFLGDRLRRATPLVLRLPEIVPLFCILSSVGVNCSLDVADLGSGLKVGRDRDLVQAVQTIDARRPAPSVMLATSRSRIALPFW